MSEYVPYRWVFLDLKYGLYKVLSAYIDGAWRLNSGIEKAEDLGDHYLITGTSGTKYKLYKDAEGTCITMPMHLLEHFEQCSYEDLPEKMK